MRQQVVVNPNGGRVRVRFAAGFAGVGTLVLAKLFDSTGTSPVDVPIVKFDGIWSGVDLAAAAAEGHILYGQFNVASLKDDHELVNVLVRVEQDSDDIAAFDGEASVVAAAEVIAVRVYLDLASRAVGK